MSFHFFGFDEDEEDRLQAEHAAQDSFERPVGVGNAAFLELLRLQAEAQAAEDAAVLRHPPAAARAAAAASQLQNLSTVSSFLQPEYRPSVASAAPAAAPKLPRPAARAKSPAVRSPTPSARKRAAPRSKSPGSVRSSISSSSNNKHKNILTTLERRVRDLRPGDEEYYRTREDTLEIKKHSPTLPPEFEAYEKLISDSMLTWDKSSKTDQDLYLAATDPSIQTPVGDQCLFYLRKIPVNESEPLIPTVYNPTQSETFRRYTVKSLFNTLQEEKIHRVLDRYGSHQVKHAKYFMAARLKSCDDPNDPARFVNTETLLTNLICNCYFSRSVPLHFESAADVLREIQAQRLPNYFARDGARQSNADAHVRAAAARKPVHPSDFLNRFKTFLSHVADTDALEGQTTWDARADLAAAHAAQQVQRHTEPYKPVEPFGTVYERFRDARLHAEASVSPSHVLLAQLAFTLFTSEYINDSEITNLAKKFNLASIHGRGDYTRLHSTRPGEFPKAVNKSMMEMLHDFIIFDNHAEEDMLADPLVCYFKCACDKADDANVLLHFLEQASTACENIQVAYDKEEETAHFSFFFVPITYFKNLSDTHPDWYQVLTYILIAEIYGEMLVGDHVNGEYDFDFWDKIVLGEKGHMLKKLYKGQTYSVGRFSFKLHDAQMRPQDSWIVTSVEKELLEPLAAIEKAREMLRTFTSMKQDIPSANTYLVAVQTAIKEDPMSIVPDGGLAAAPKADAAPPEADAASVRDAGREGDDDYDYNDYGPGGGGDEDYDNNVPDNASVTSMGAVSGAPARRASQRLASKHALDQLRERAKALARPYVPFVTSNPAPRRGAARKAKLRGKGLTWSDLEMSSSDEEDPFNALVRFRATGSKRLQGGDLGDAEGAALHQAEAQELTGEQMGRITGCEVVKYPDLAKYATMQDLPPKGVVALFLTGPEEGHWTWLGKRPAPPTGVFFDPLGLAADAEKKFVDAQTIEQLGETVPQFHRLLSTCPNIDVSHFKWQKNAPGVNTCGRWTALRALHGTLSNDDFHALIQKAIDDSGLTNDEWICTQITP